MGRKANTILQDALKCNELNYRLEVMEESLDRKKETFTYEEILEEAIYVKDFIEEGNNDYDTIFDETLEEIKANKIAVKNGYDKEWIGLKKEYDEVCKFIDKWLKQQKKTIKQADNDKTGDNKKILKSLEKGTKINISEYGIVEFIQVNRTRFYAIYKDQEWSFPIDSFIEVIK